jgi:DNA-binding SARP family transcriptional activator/tetratricopeptide (TPR) repeat protein
MELRLLGPVEINAGGRPLGVGVPQRQALLAALAVDAGRVVSRHQLIDRVWDEPPARVDAAVYVHVSGLRRTLEQASAAEDRAVPASLDRQPGGYLLRVDADEVDLHRFRRLTVEARERGCPPAERVRLLREALGLWRGPALAGLSGEWAARMREGWGQERLDSVVAWADAELRADRSAGALEVLGPLAELAAEQPISESVTAMLMQALVAAGRPADALDRYTKIRRRLVDQLGVDPGPELRALYRAILRGSLGPPPPVALATPPAATPPAPAPAVPAQLPADVAAFTGRGAELAELDTLLGAEPAAVVISAVAGTAGVGKTALAVRWAHHNRGRFPDGQLYVDLRGYHPDRPMPADDALAGFLAALGVPSQDIPIDRDARAARYRTETADRRILILLDNAASVEQVRPLLPGTASCTVLVTSRDSLADLVAVHGARRVHLDVLPLPDAHALLRRLVGLRVDAQPRAAETLANECARLPLALRIAAELANSRPTTRLTDLVADLADRQHRLEILHAGTDPHAAVRAVFSWSIQHLPGEAARTFGLLGLHPGPDLDVYAAAALTNTTLPHAQHALDLLARAHLVQPTSAGRYGMHDLLRAYSNSLAGSDDATDDPRDALARLFDYYLATTATAMNRLYPAEAHNRPEILPTAAPTPSLADPDTARAWLDTERPTLVAMAAYTASHGWPTHTVRLSAILFRYLTSGYHTDAFAIHSYARDAAEHTGDTAGTAQALASLGAAHMQLGRLNQAAEQLQQALGLYRQVNDLAGQARALGGLGTVDERQGHNGAALDHLQQALALHRQLGNRIGEARTLNNLAIVDGRLGRYEAAASHYEEALSLCRQVGHRTGEAWALNNLATVETRLGRHLPAIDHLQQALTLHRQLGNRTGEAHALDSLGTAHFRFGQPEPATAHHRQALALFRESGDRDGEAWALNGLGDAANATGHPTNALARYGEALALATETGARDQQARAHAGLGRTHHTLGNRAQAREHYRHALAGYTELGSPDADDIRTRLAALGQPAACPRSGSVS